MSDDLILCEQCGLTLLAGDAERHDCGPPLPDEGARAASFAPPPSATKAHVCEGCGRDFPSHQALGGHRRWCDARGTADAAPAAAAPATGLASASIGDLRRELLSRLRAERDRLTQRIAALEGE